MPATNDTALAVRYQPIAEDPRYRVGDDGSAWSCAGNRTGVFRADGVWRQLKPGTQSRGHKIIELGRDNYRFVHRLVLEAFVGPCPEGMECRHIDGNPGNNRLDNLAWGTRQENYADSVRHGTAQALRGDDAFGGKKGWDYVKHKSGERHHRAKLTDAQIQIVRDTVTPGVRDGTAKRLAIEWNVSATMISMIARGVRRRTG